MRRSRLTAVLFLALVLALALGAPLAALGAGKTNPAPSSDAAKSRPTHDTAYALVQLKGDPLATYEKTKPAPGKKIDFDSSTVKAYRAQLAQLRNDFKAWLRANAPKARITGEFDLALNAVSVQLNGTDLAQIAAAPMVQRAEYEGLYYPTADDPDLGIIDAIAAWTWNQEGDYYYPTAGEGIKVAVVDTGIDVSHPCFADNGYAPQTKIGDPRFTNNKVIAAKVFNNKAGSRGYTPAAIQDHGTHVAGTIACNYDTPAVVGGVDIPYGVSGVAPRALLGNYNVFPGDVLSARSEDILNALEAAYADGFDVANMSLGGGSSGIQDLLSVAVDNLDLAGMVVAVAAGNSGPGLNTIESPGIAPRALTAGASSVPHFVGTPVTVGEEPNRETYGAAAGDFAVVETDLTAPLAVVSGSTNGLSTACSALSENLTGKIALISRGGCTFSTKIRNAQNAGAVAVLVANNVAGDPTAMAQDGTPNQPTVPAYMVGLAHGQALTGKDGSSATISASLAYFSTDNVDIMAGFSSQGPTDVDLRVKPDVVAPGVNVLSSIPLSFCGEEADTCWAFFQGTSMATPHLAGAAAVVKGQHSTWSPAQIRSAIVNTAERGVLTKYTDRETPETNVNVIGAGRLNLLNAVNAKVALDPVSISFGAVPAGSGQTKTFDVTLTNLSGAELDLAPAIGPTTGSGVTFSVSPSEPITLAAGASATIKVTLTAEKGAGFGGHQAWLTITDGSGEIAHAAVFVYIK